MTYDTHVQNLRASQLSDMFNHEPLNITSKYRVQRTGHNMYKVQYWSRVGWILRTDNDNQISLTQTGIDRITLYRL